MNKLAKMNLQRVFAGASAFMIIALAFASVYSTMLALRPQSVSAQALPTTYEWVNASTIKSGDVLFTDGDISDAVAEFLASGITRCSNATLNRSNIPSDRIVLDNVGNQNANGNRLKLNADVDQAGQLKCEAPPVRVSPAASSTGNSKVTLYRTGDTINSVISGGTSFAKTATVNTGGGDVEVFYRNGDSGNGGCKDAIVHGTAGKFQGYFIFPMGLEGVYPAAPDVGSDNYGPFDNDSPDSLSGKCRLSPYDLIDWKIANAPEGGQCETPDEVVCGPGTNRVDVNWPGQFEGQPGGMWKVAFTMGSAVNAPDPDAAGTADDEIRRTACDNSFSFVEVISLKWLICPIIDLIMRTITFLEDFLTSQLQIDVAPYASDSAFHGVWASIRTLALALIVIAGIFMVIAQAAGIEFLSAYSMKTLFGKFVWVFFIIVVSMPAFAIFVGIINIFTDGISTIIYAPFANQFGGELESGSSAMMALLGTGAVLALGPWGLLSFAGTAALSIGITVLLITAMKGLFLMLAVFYPISKAFSLLPNTKPISDFVDGTVTSLAIAFILIGAAMPFLNVLGESFIAMGGTLNQLIGWAIKVARVFVIAMILMQIRGFASTLTGGVQGLGRSAGDRLKNFRGNQVSGRHAGRMDGTKKTFGSEGLSKVYRRAGNVGNGGLSVTRRGRARYGEHQRAQLAAKTEEMLKRDNGRFAGDDDANALAQQKGMTENQFVNDYMRRTGVSAQTARETLAGIENSYGAKLGTDGMRVAAFRARASSKTAYASGHEGYNQAYKEAGTMVAQGLMTQADATQALKSNKDRADFAGVGFNETMKMVGHAAGRVSSGASGDLSRPGQEIITADEAKKLTNDALDGASPGQLIGGYHKGVSTLAPAMAERLQDTLANNNGNLGAAMAQFAAYNARKDLMGQVSEKSGKILSQQVGAQQVTFRQADDSFKTMTIDEVSEIMRSPDQAMSQLGIDTVEYQRMKREYGTSMASAHNAEQAARAGMGGPPPHVPSGPGSI